MGIPELGGAIETFKLCLMNNRTPEDRLAALKNEFNREALLSGSGHRYDRLLSIIRTAMSKYRIDCTTDLPNGAPVWKKVVRIIWLEKHDAICMAKKGGTKDKQPSGPPMPPKLPELNEDVLEPTVVSQLMEQFNPQLRIEMVNHTDNIVETVVSVIEKRFNLDKHSQRGSTRRSGSLGSQETDSNAAQSLLSLREPQDVRLLEQAIEQDNYQPNAISSHQHHAGRHEFTTRNDTQQAPCL